MSTNNGVLSAPYGVVIQQVCDWPFQKQITLKHIEFVDVSYGGTPRVITVHDGLYQNMGLVSTSLGPSSMGAHPLTKKT